MFVLQRCLGVSFSACQVGGPGLPVPRMKVSGGGGSVRPAGSLWHRVGAPHPSNQNGIGGCGLLRLLLFSNNPSAWVRHLRAVNGSGLVCGVSVRLRVLSVASDLFPSEGCTSSDLSSLYEFTVRWMYTVPVDCNGG
ncbi:unnamed protein product, partial [Brassica oleracea]